MNRLFLLSVVCMGCLWIGCGKSEKTVVGPDGSKTTVTKKGDGMDITVKGPDGETTHFATGGSGVALPEGFPDSVPIYAGAKVATSAKTKEGMMVALTTADAAKKVAQFYQQKLKANGWDIETTTDMQDGSMVVAKKDKFACIVVVSGGENQTTVSLNVTEEKKN